MTRGEMMTWLTERAAEYAPISSTSINRNSHMNEVTKADVIDQKIVDAVLTDFVNYVGMCQGMDYGLHTSDLADERAKKKIEEI